MSENNFNPKPRISMILPLPVSLLLIVLFFMPWLAVSCEGGEVTRAMQKSGAANMPPMSGMPQVTAKVAQATGWQLAKGDISLKGAYARKNGRAGSQREMLKSRPALYMALVVPILALIIGGFGVAGNAKAGTVGTALLLLAIVGTATVLWAASIDYVDDAMDKLQEEATNSGCGGPAPRPTGVDEAKANMKKLIKTRGTGYLWASLGMYVLLAGCGIAGRGTPPGLAYQSGHASSSAAARSGLPKRPHRASAGGLPDFGPTLSPKGPARETEDAGASGQRTYIMRTKDGV